MIYVLTERAKQDLESITDFSLKHFGRLQTQAYLLQLESTLKSLATMPSAGRLRSELAPSIRSQPCSRHNIYYLAQDNGIKVVRILHQSMEPSGRL
jgi:toxin ParE1/3/4